MNDPESYRKAELLNTDIKHFLNEEKHLLRFRPNGGDSLLDIGCAGGNVTVEVIKSILPKDFSRIVGIDINETMVRYANRRYKAPKITFEVLDIGGEVTDFLNSHGHFDNITSTMCLHLVPDQKKALKNIYDLLEPNGNCLLYIIVDSILCDMYVKMNRKWLRYMEDLDDYLSPYYGKANPEFLLKRNLASAGFIQYEVKTRLTNVVCESVQQLKDRLKTVIPFFHRIPSTEEQEEFLEEFAQFAKKNISVHLNNGKTCNKSNEDENGHEDKFVLPHQIMTAVARKI